jgi:Na+/H+ antiporter NhaD/arsenite permease-like protein
MVKLLNDLTGGQLLLWKIVLASMVFTMSGLQVLLAARFYEASTVPPISTGIAARTHRLNGRATLILALVVAFTCLAGPAGPVSPARVLLHSIFGSLVFALLAFKYTVLKFARRADRFLPWIGSGLFLCFGAIWATSVADYISR